MSSLEEEAKEFLNKKKAPAESITDETGFRFYMGCALSGLLSNGGLVTRPEEVLNEAANYAILALQKEKTFRGS